MDNNQPNYESKNEFGQNPYPQGVGQQVNYRQNSGQQMNYQQTAYEQAVNKKNNADKVNYSGGYVQPGTNDGSYGMSIAGMILGIVSIVFSCASCISFVLGVVGVVLSAVALSANSKGKEMAIAGVICSIIGIFASIVWGILFILD